MLRYVYAARVVHQRWIYRTSTLRLRYIYATSTTRLSYGYATLDVNVIELLFSHSNCMSGSNIMREKRYAMPMQPLCQGNAGSTLRCLHLSTLRLRLSTLRLRNIYGMSTYTLLRSCV